LNWLSAAFSGLGLDGGMNLSAVFSGMGIERLKDKFKVIESVKKHKFFKRTQQEDCK